MNIKNVVSNDLFQEDSLIWFLKEHNEFGYSDGIESEKYLESVFKSVSDLSSTSLELERYIKDWPSEYHLSTKRAQLFSGFDFDSSLNVLEVGCGCGAITRYLGENFDHVISVEGSIKRAQLAKLRAGTLDNVSIICAPFQKINFIQKFDVIFCIGVYEYSASFVDGDNPYDSVLEYFSNILTPNGTVIIAIENQFGLKYFNSSNEDHLARRYEGLEGYHANRSKVKTFGKQELEYNLRKYFKDISFYYPYPDYKMPDCVLSENFLASSQAGELVSQIKSRDYVEDLEGLWNESLVSLELSKNGMLPFFSNSFLVFAGKSDIKNYKFDQLAILNSSHRSDPFRTKTRIYFDNKKIVASKKLLSGKKTDTVGKLIINESFSNWNNVKSLQTIIFSNFYSNEITFLEVFSECKVWVDYLDGNSKWINGEKYLDGKYLDCVFSNFYVDNTAISIIDEEWVWDSKIRFNIIIIRAFFTFFQRIEESKKYKKLLRKTNVKKIIIDVCASLGVNLNKSDFINFYSLEHEFKNLSNDLLRNDKYILKWYVCGTWSYTLCRRYFRKYIFFTSRVRFFLSRINIK